MVGEIQFFGLIGERPKPQFQKTGAKKKQKNQERKGEGWGGN